MTNLHDYSQGDIIITPNRRLAHFLQQRYTQKQIDSGKTCWETPTILPVNVWIDLLWQQHTQQSFETLPHVLNQAQELLLWETVLAESAYHDHFLQITETARLVKSARGLLKQWRVSTSHPLFTTADDYAALVCWIEKFEQVCQEHNWIDAASLPDFIATELQNGNITAPTKIYHTGFAELSPQLTALLAICPSVEALSIQQSATKTVRVTTSDPDEELRLCANWAKGLHEQYPEHTIACVLPLLDKRRNRVVQIFNEVFSDHEAFNISAGQPLSHYPIVHAALELLMLYKNQINAESLFFILATPFIGGAESERMARCQFDSRLRSKNFSIINLAQQLHGESSGTSLSKSCPQLAKRIKKFKELLSTSPTEASYAHWAQLFNALLSALGWPGERIINSEEYQVVEEWLRLLQAITTLDVTSPPVRFDQALRVLMQEAATKPFQPQSPNTNVQVLGILEAAGLSFDHVWVSGLDDSCWPAQPKPNPFIPKRLQRDLKMPHASAERELEYCEAMTRQFMTSAADIVFSYAKTQDDTLMQPSPLIRSLPEVDAHQVVPQFKQPDSELIYQQRDLEKIMDETAPAMQSGEVAAGGVEIIKNQALCPFKAFAECRLMAREIENPLPGLRSKERGTIVHVIMEKCWKHLQSSERLQNIDEAELGALLDEIIAQALLEHAPAQTHQNSYLVLEKIRLKKLTLDWLQVEKERAPFIVTSSEKEEKIQLNQLSISMRIDRIDQLESGKHLIIDYKTGANKETKSWLGDRPEEPQLPLYAQLDSTCTAGIAFAQVAAGKHSFKGISQYPLDIKGIAVAEEMRATDKKDWPTLTAEWRSVLTKLGDDFYHGKAEVDPKEKTTCQYCGLKPLCRIHQDGGIQDDE